MEIALICVSGVIAFVKWKKQIPVGIAGANVRFQFDDNCWKGLTKTIVFQGAETKDVILDGDSCELPQEVVSKIGASVRVGVYGTDSEKNIAIPTLWARIGIVQDATDPSGDSATDPSIPIWAQLKEEIDGLKDAGGVNVPGVVPGQMIRVKEVGETGKPTAWEPVPWGWVEQGGMVEILPECQPEYSEADGGFVALVAITPMAGDTYTVNWNGVEYICVAQDLSAMIPGAVLLGDGTDFGATGNGEPFAILIVENDGVKACIAVPLDGTTELTISIVGEVRIVHKLDPMYLPDDVGGVELFDIPFTVGSFVASTTMTFAEIYEKVTAANTIVRGVGTIDGLYFVFSLQAYSASQIVFSLVQATASNGLQVMSIVVNSDDTCTFATSIK